VSDMRGTAVPSCLFLPVCQQVGGDIRALVRMTPEGVAALVAYTDRERLVAAWGSAQSWAEVATGEIGEVRARQPFDMIALDAGLGSYR
jgi:hypothetical protein